VGDRLLDPGKLFSWS